MIALRVTTVKYINYVRSTHMYGSSPQPRSGLSPFLQKLRYMHHCIALTFFYLLSPRLLAQTSCKGFSKNYFGLSPRFSITFKVLFCRISWTQDNIRVKQIRKKQLDQSANNIKARDLLARCFFSKLPVWILLILSKEHSELYLFEISSTKSKYFFNPLPVPSEGTIGLPYVHPFVRKSVLLSVRPQIYIMRLLEKYYSYTSETSHLDR